MTYRKLALGVFLCLSIGAPIAGCDGPHNGIEIPEAGVNDAGPGTDVGMSFFDTGIGVGDLNILRVVPNHGPFSGGNVAILRGGGFTDSAQVVFGTHMVQPADHTLIDSRRLQVVVPAGEVGPVDVTIDVGGTMFTLQDGYTYDAISVDPGRGSVAGGTFVNIVGSGTSFSTGDTVFFGRTPCNNVVVISPTRITCRAPAGTAGTVDVTVVNHTDSTETTAVQAYDYYDTADPFAGGLGGGPANGTINVTAINAQTGMPVEGAFVIVDQDLSTPHQGFTDAMGQITFSGPDLVGQHSVHISKHCFERTSFVAFDAQDATAFLYPWQDPMCGMGSGGGGGRGRNAAFISGDLLFHAGNDDGRVTWDIIPRPRDGWVRVAYVATTQLSITQNGGLGRDDYPNPDPSLGGGMPRVVEQATAPDGRGFPYIILARPAGLAVYALGGLENTATGQFIPYVMGVARNVLVGPGETRTGIDIDMNIPLDHSLVANLGHLPAQVRRQPDRFYMRAVMDLGGEGVIVREVNNVDFDTIRRRDTGREFRFVGVPALQGTLSDGRFSIIAGWTNDFEQPPYTVVLPHGITAVDDAVQLPDFLGIPDAVSPAAGERIPADRVLRWQEVDGAPADFHVILMSGGDGNPAWRMFVRGDQHEAAIPDLSSIPMVDDISSGFGVWVVYSVTIPGFDFDNLTYTQINEAYWSAYSYNYFSVEI